MTKAVAGAGQSAAQSVLDAVSQAASARAGMRKANAKVAQDDEPQPENRAREPRSRDATSSEAPDRDRVENDGKVARRREHGDAKDSDDSDTSFAATIDSIDRPAPQIASTDATQGAQQAMRWTPEMAFGQIGLNGRGQRTPTDVAAVSTNAETPMRSPKLLKSESITALLAAQNRMLSGEGTDTDAASNDAADATQATPIVVDSLKTHWRFGADATSAGTLQPPTPTDGHAVSNPLAMLNATGAAKGKDDTAQTAASDKIKLETASAPTPAAVTPAGDTQARQSFDGQQGGGASPRDHAPNGAGERKVSDSIASRSVEHASSDATGVTAGLSPATTQVRNGVLDALTGGTGDTKPSGAPATLADRPAAPAQVLRTMELTLSPPDLGSVKLKLSLKSNELSIEAETSKAATAKILNDDRDSLKQNLQNAGYDVSALKITDASASSAMGSNSSQTGSQTGSPFQDNSQARASFAERQGGDTQRRDSAAQDQGQQRSGRDNPRGSEATDTTAPRQGNAVYI